MQAATMKLIHSGKVLKDEDKIESCGIKENDFLVVMVTKAKKPAAAPAPAPAAAAAPAPAAPETPAAPAAAPAAASTEATPAASSSTDTPAAPARPSAADEFPAEVVSNLTGMGFPEAEVRHCLRAASGNPDIAMEFLTNGIPPGVEAAAAGGASPALGSSSGAGGLQALRNHPQFNQLRRLVQTNPQMLQTVLTQIGQQQPELLQEINANQAAFLAMMNEPVEDAPAPAANASGGSSSTSSGAAGARGLGAGMLEGMANPAQMAQMIQSMSPTELNQMAAMMGLSADQLRQTAQMLGQIPPEQLQQYMMQAMGGGGGMEGMAGLMGGAGMGGPQVLRLNEEEMAAVDRLTEMGFDRAEAAQAFLACDKNEALAANLLMDSMGDGGGGFGFGGDGSGSGGDNNNNNNGGGDNNNNDDDAMYD
jgi:UV excision repair protein RAD23